MRRNRQSRRSKTKRDDLAFPVNYHEQAKYLKLADDFLSDENPFQNEKVIPIDSARKFLQRQKKKAA